MLEMIILSPPVAFVIMLGALVLLSHFLSKCAFQKVNPSAGAKDAYSCGEEFTGHLIQPDYSQFFPFAFFFTILHVVAMVIASIPAETTETFTMAVIYILGAIIGLFILLRK